MRVLHLALEGIIIQWIHYNCFSCSYTWFTPHVITKS